MFNTVLDYLDLSAERYRDKDAYVDEHEAYSFGMLQKYGKSIGTQLITRGIVKKPIAIFLDKSVREIASFIGVLYSGGFYCPIDVEMPSDRIRKIINTLEPSAIITDIKHKEMISSLSDCEILDYDEMIKMDYDEMLLSKVRLGMINTDPAYVLFTSGSTGDPKGVLINHASIMDFTEWMSDKFKITSKDNFGNQSPLHFDLSIGDLYCTLKDGCTNYLIPKQYFAFPAKLIPYMNEKKISIIFWVPSALCLVANLRILNKVVPQYLTRVLFCGEVMPNKQLNVWRKALPNALYANLYGPCEACDASTYYIVDREFADDDSLPIGFACENTEIVVLNEEDKLVKEDEIGELCIKGIGLALGYYNNPEKTAQAFVQNPLNNKYPEIIYRTGDLVKYNQYGELIYISRKDFQIKHMGHRIELGEIESALGDMAGYDECACIYDDKKSKIVFCYSGKADELEVRRHIEQKVSEYMVPSVFIKMRAIPHNSNGKIDRKRIKEMYINGEVK